MKDKRKRRTPKASPIPEKDTQPVLETSSENPELIEAKPLIGPPPLVEVVMDESELQGPKIPESLEKRLADQERKEARKLKERNTPILSFMTKGRSILFIYSALSFFLLLTTAYYTTKFVQYTFPLIGNDAIATRQIEETTSMPEALDTSIQVFDQTDDYSSQSALVYDLSSGYTLYSKKPDNKTYIASLTKMVSTKVLLDTVSLQDQVEINEDVEKIGGSALQMKKGQKLSKEDLLKAAVIASSNQAIFAVNDPDDTVSKMNKLVDALGLTDTHFTNPAGFDDGDNSSSANDLVPLAKLFFNTPLLFQYASSSKTELTDLTTGQKLKITNTNDLLRLGVPNVLAGKTGTTQKAGQNLVLLVEKNGHRYLVVLLNGADRYKDAYKVLARL